MFAVTLTLLETFVATLNTLWGGGLEAVLGTAAAIGGIPAIWWWLLPRYTAVCCHDGEKWISDLPGTWSAARGVAAGDLEPYTKQWLGQYLMGGKFVTPKEARVPVNPVPRYHHVEWWGQNRGVYYIVGVKVRDPSLLAKFPNRCDHAPTQFEEPDEYIRL